MQNVGIRLAYGMGYGAILDVASVDIKILTVRPAARVGGAGNDAPQGNQAVFQFGAKALFGEFDPQNVAYAFRRIGGTPVFLRLVVVKQAKGNVVLGQRYAFTRVHAVAVFRGFRDRTRVVWGKRWSVLVDFGGCLII